MLTTKSSKLKHSRKPSKTTPPGRFRTFLGRSYSGIAFTHKLRKVVAVALLILTPLLAWVGYQSIMDFVITPARNKAELTAEFDKIHLPEGFELVGTETRFDTSCFGDCARIEKTYRITISKEEAQKIVLKAFEGNGYKTYELSEQETGGNRLPFAYRYANLPGGNSQIIIWSTK